MPVYLIYILIVLAAGTVAGVGFRLGSWLVAILAIIGFVVVVAVLYKPLREAIIEKIKKY